ncbi:glycosyltransferase [Aliidiomarina soli]|uniref:Glycosyltransferase family 2 protein n=1 Tax=Aliidiomarina soli TaxID=1928574 RepID=A0A432WD59_9GAMM|nr:glycosyltransferase [Aliidiomarina soli]RUO30335.1 glycosyltransferase family 2 protein [Aliidiomarina soli]
MKSHDTDEGVNTFVTVIVPTYNDWEDLSRCIKALEEQTYPLNEFEIIVANNNPDNKLPKNLSMPSNARLIEVEAPGSYAARNAALNIAKGEVIAFTDSDCTPASDWIENGMKSLTSGVDRVAGKVTLYFRKGKLSLAEMYEKAFAFRQERNVSEGRSVTANLFVRRWVFESVGPFDATLMSGGDMAWNRLATSEGISLTYAADCVVYHPARHSMELLKKKKKRVSGGVASIGKVSKKEILRRFLPPMFALSDLRKRSDLSGKEKMAAFFILYYLKIFSAVSMIKVITGIEKASRD